MILYTGGLVSALSPQGGDEKIFLNHNRRNDVDWCNVRSEKIDFTV